MSSVSGVLTAARRRVPRRLLPLLYAVRFALAWPRRAVREDARAQMRFLLERTRTDADLDAVARAYVKHQIRRGELRWHPELLTGLRVVGLEHLTAARSRGKGVVLSFAHHGFYDGAFPSIAREGVPCHMVAYGYMLRPDAPAWLRQHVAVATAGGGRAVSAEIGHAGLVELLGRGEVVAIASDVPGRTPVRFAGRDVLGSFGAARVSAETGAPTVVLTTEVDEDGPLIRLHEPLLPSGPGSARGLLDSILRVHEEVQLRWPEATDIPVSRWGASAADGEDGGDAGAVAGAARRVPGAHRRAS